MGMNPLPLPPPLNGSALLGALKAWVLCALVTAGSAFQGSGPIYIETLFIATYFWLKPSLVH